MNLFLQAMISVMELIRLIRLARFQWILLYIFESEFNSLASPIKAIFCYIKMQVSTCRCSGISAFANGIAGSNSFTHLH